MLSTKPIPSLYLLRFWRNAEVENYNRLRIVIFLMLLASIINLLITSTNQLNFGKWYFIVNSFFTLASIVFLSFVFVLSKPIVYHDIKSSHIRFTTSYIFVISICAGVFAGIEPRPEASLFFYLCGLIVPGVLLMTRWGVLISSVSFNTISFFVVALCFRSKIDYMSFLYVLCGFGALIIGVSIIKRQLYVKQFLVSVELERHNENLEAILKERTAELTAAKEKAEESDRLKSAFISNLNHELRTPLNGIVGFVSLLSEGNLSPEKIKRYTKLIQANSNHLLKIVSDILDIARIQSNQMTLKIETISVVDVVKNLNLFCTHELAKLEKQNIEILFNENIEDLYINTDSNRLVQVLQNIVSNSIKYTNQGNVSVNVSVERQNIVFTISDTGIGIPHDRIQSIFEPFRQGDDSFTRSHQGTGLGLAIAYKLVKLMNGEILIKSELNKGTVFSIILNQCIADRKIIVSQNVE